MTKQRTMVEISRRGRDVQARSGGRPLSKGRSRQDVLRDGRDELRARDEQLAVTKADARPAWIGYATAFLNTWGNAGQLNAGEIKTLRAPERDYDLDSTALENASSTRNARALRAAQYNLTNHLRDNLQGVQSVLAEIAQDTVYHDDPIRAAAVQLSKQLGAAQPGPAPVAQPPVPPQPVNGAPQKAAGAKMQKDATVSTAQGLVAHDPAPKNPTPVGQMAQAETLQKDGAPERGTTFAVSRNKTATVKQVSDKYDDGTFMVIDQTGEEWRIKSDDKGGWTKVGYLSGDKLHKSDLSVAGYAPFTNYVSIISKRDDEHLVEGFASSSRVDTQDDIVDPSALKAALSDFMKWANLREMHENIAAGTVLKAEPVTSDLKLLDGRLLKYDDARRSLALPDGSEIIDPVHIVAHVVNEGTWNKFKSGVLKGFSIGGKVIDFVNELVGMKQVRRITKLLLTEISGVDRPANPDAMVMVMKRYQDPDEILQAVIDMAKVDSGDKLAHAANLRKFSATFDQDGEKVSLDSLPSFMQFADANPFINDPNYAKVCQTLLDSDVARRNADNGNIVRLELERKGEQGIARFFSVVTGKNLGAYLILTLWVPQQAAVTQPGAMPDAGQVPAAASDVVTPGDTTQPVPTGAQGEYLGLAAKAQLRKDESARSRKSVATQLLQDADDEELKEWAEAAFIDPDKYGNMTHKDLLAALVLEVSSNLKLADQILAQASDEPSDDDLAAIEDKQNQHRPGDVGAMDGSNDYAAGASVSLRKYSVSTVDDAKKHLLDAGVSVKDPAIDGMLQEFTRLQDMAPDDSYRFEVEAIDNDTVKVTLFQDSREVWSETVKQTIQPVRSRMLRAVGASMRKGFEQGDEAGTDSAVAQELIDYAYNKEGGAAGLQGQYNSIVANQKRRGDNYDQEQAVKLWRLWINRAAQEYARDEGDVRQAATMFPTKVRDTAARMVENLESNKLGLRNDYGAAQVAPNETPRPSDWEKAARTVLRKAFDEDDVTEYFVEAITNGTTPRNKGEGDVQWAMRLSEEASAEFNISDDDFGPLTRVAEKAIHAYETTLSPNAQDDEDDEEHNPIRHPKAEKPVMGRYMRNAARASMRKQANKVLDLVNSFIEAHQGAMPANFWAGLIQTASHASVPEVLAYFDESIGKVTDRDTIRDYGLFVGKLQDLEEQAALAAVVQTAPETPSGDTETAGNAPDGQQAASNAQMAGKGQDGATGQAPVGAPGALQQVASGGRLNKGHKSDQFLPTGTPEENQPLLDSIRSGSRVTIMTPQGQEATGRAVMRSSDGGWALNMGGAHGRPGLVDIRNIVRVSGTRKLAKAGLTQREIDHLRAQAAEPGARPSILPPGITDKQVQDFATRFIRSKGGPAVLAGAGGAGIIGLAVAAFLQEVPMLNQLGGQAREYIMAQVKAAAQRLTGGVQPQGQETAGIAAPAAPVAAAAGDDMNKSIFGLFPNQQEQLDATNQQTEQIQRQTQASQAQQQAQLALTQALRDAVNAKDAAKLQQVLSQMQNGNHWQVPGELWDLLRQGNWTGIATVIGQALGQSAKGTAQGVANQVAQGPLLRAPLAMAGALGTAASGAAQAGRSALGIQQAAKGGALRKDEDAPAAPTAADEGKKRATATKLMRALALAGPDAKHIIPNAQAKIQNGDWLGLAKIIAPLAGALSEALPALGVELPEILTTLGMVAPMASALLLSADDRMSKAVDAAFDDLYTDGSYDIVKRAEAAVPDQKVGATAVYKADDGEYSIKTWPLDGWRYGWVVNGPMGEDLAHGESVDDSAAETAANRAVERLMNKPAKADKPANADKAVATTLRKRYAGDVLGELPSGWVSELRRALRKLGESSPRALVFNKLAEVTAPLDHSVMLPGFGNPGLAKMLGVDIAKAGQGEMVDDATVLHNIIQTIATVLADKGDELATEVMGLYTAKEQAPLQDQQNPLDPNAQASDQDTGQGIGGQGLPNNTQAPAQGGGLAGAGGPVPGI